jgi:hypothetical protein
MTLDPAQLDLFVESSPPLTPPAREPLAPPPQRNLGAPRAPCTSVAGGNAELTPKNTDADAATSIVFNGNARFVVGRDYVIRVDRK